MNYQKTWKRAFDLLLALFGATIVAPVILLGYVLVRISSAGPGFFVQERLGYQGIVFKVFKLRTMHLNPERKLNQTINTDPDVFVVGKILRRTKIDELPQVFNVLIGDMSLVGPRPGLPSMLEEMPEWAKMRWTVRPGLTGLAQVNGNIELSWEERWQYDIEYIEKVTILNDLMIIVRTVLVVLFGEALFRRVP